MFGTVRPAQRLPGRLPGRLPTSSNVFHENTSGVILGRHSCLGNRPLLGRRNDLLPTSGFLAWRRLAGVPIWISFKQEPPQPAVVIGSGGHSEAALAKTEELRPNSYRREAASWIQLAIGKRLASRLPN